MLDKKNSLRKVAEFQSFEINFQGINLLSLSQIYLFEKGLGRLNNRDLLTKIKRLSLENFVKSFMLLFKSNYSGPKDVEYAFVNDVYNLSMIGNMNAVKDKFNHQYVELITDKRLKNKHTVSLFSSVGMIRFFFNLPAFLLLIKNNQKTIEKVGKSFGIKKRYVILNLIDSFYVYFCAKQFLDKFKKLKKILLNTDVHKTSRMLVLLAAKKKIATNVIQHGAPVLEYGYLPVISDNMFVWGEISMNWFLERGTPLKKLILTGTPKADDIAKHPSFLEHKKVGVKKVLLIINPVGTNNVMEVLKICKKAELDTNYELVIKLHPSSNDNKEEVEAVFANSARILKYESIHNLLADTDLVITTTSTVGNEAIAFYKPLLQIKLQGLIQSMDYELYDCSHSIESSNQLKSLLEDTTALNSKIKNYRSYIEKYFFSIDGKASERIVDFLTKEE